MAEDAATTTETTTSETTETTQEKAFTQADLDAKIQERLNREQRKYADYEDLKTKAAEFDKLSESQKTELQKAVDAAKKEARDEALAEVTKDRFADRVLLHAAKDFADPEDAVLRLKDRFSDFTGKDGSIDNDAIKAELKTLLKGKPHLAASSSGTNSPGSVDGGAREPASSSEVSPGYGRIAQAYANSSTSK